MAAFRPPALWFKGGQQSRSTGTAARILHIVGVLVLVRGRLDVATVELVVQNVAGVLLGLFGGVGVVDVGLVAANDVACVGHCGGVDGEVEDW